MKFICLYNLYYEHDICYWFWLTNFSNYGYPTEKVNSFKHVWVKRFFMGERNGSKINLFKLTSCINDLLHKFIMSLIKIMKEDLTSKNDY